MSGHSKWANIKNRKGAQDKKRSEAFTKISKDILTAVRMGGGNTNPEANNLLRVAMEKARAVNMPKDNIERLLTRFEERKANLVGLYLEGFGPGGVPVIVEVETDNKNRTLGEIKLIFKNNEGSLGEEGSVSYQFEKLYRVELEKTVEEEEMLQLIDVGARDFDGNEVMVETGQIEEFKKAVGDMGIGIVSSELTLESKMPIKVGEEVAGKLLDLKDELEENEDVVKVFAGFTYE